MIDGLSIAVHAFVSRVLKSFSVDETLLPRLVKLSTSFREVPSNIYIYIYINSTVLHCIVSVSYTLSHTTGYVTQTVHFTSLYMLHIVGYHCPSLKQLLFCLLRGVNSCKLLWEKKKQQKALIFFISNIVSFFP